MATMVGTQKELAKLLNALIELDLDAVEAYKAAIDKLENTNDKTQLSAFLADHERHVTDLRPLVVNLGETPATKPDIKAVLTKGKVVLAALVGDRAVLSAMKTNEDDTNTAYERASARNDLTAEIRTVLVKNLSDERRHREYIEGRIASLGETRHATV